MGETLAVGGYTDADREALARDFSADFVANLDAALGLPEEKRAEVRAIALKYGQSFGGPEMDAFPNLGLIANFGVGYDAIDVDAAKERGIRVTNTPDVLNDDVADLTILLMLAQARKLVEGSDWVRSGNWAEGRDLPLARKMSGARVGICGLGRIGREIADRCTAFKMEIHYHSRSEKETPGWTYHADPVSLARAVDFYVVALVGGPETEGYVSREVIEALGRKGVLVNISRGTTIDEGAMLDALESGALGGAALDVFRGEPRIDPRFMDAPNTVLQPHVGSATHATRAAMGQLQRDNVAAFHAGRDLLTPVV